MHETVAPGRALECCGEGCGSYMDISKEEFDVNPEISRAWTLAARLYTDPEVLGDEKTKIFSRTWQVAGHASQVANPGDFFTTEMIGEPLLFVRGADGLLRG